MNFRNLMAAVKDKVEMRNEIGHRSEINPDYFNQGRESDPKKPGAEAVQHYEIGEATGFLRPFGKTYREALENLITGSIQIIGLDEVKAQYAEQWGQIKHNVMEIADAYISRKLGRHDIFVPLDEGHFALLFAEATRKQALEKSKVIAQDLVNKLFGELPGGELISVEAAMLEIEDFDGLDRIRSLDGLVKCFREAIGKAKERESRSFQERETELNVRFRPLINGRKGFVGMYEAVSMTETNGEKEDVTDDDPLFNASPRLRAEMDCVILREVGAVLEKLGGPGNKPVIFLTVHFETLANSYFRSKYARILASLPRYTERHLILNVQDIASGVPNSRYRQIFTSLRQLVLGFTFEVGPHWTDFAAIRDLPILAITLAGHESLELSEIETLFRRARENGKKCIWRSLDNDALARSAFKMKIDYVSGPIFSTLQPAPAKPFTLPK
tara:strand:+ start:24028 stop:25356 length:1329 start_codon:yes stop_codon:yes gene_type:complete